MRNVTIAALSMQPRQLCEKPEGVSLVDYEIEWLKEHIEKILPQKPDLIVMPECCDRPRNNIPWQRILEYYDERQDKVVAYLQSVARENRCYIAHSAWRQETDGTARNSVSMIDRQGKIMGHYNKNYGTFLEFEYYKIKTGKDIAVFECDFGRVAPMICFDMNFPEFRQRIKDAEVDIVLFSSNYHAGDFVRKFYAMDTRAYFVAACGYGLQGGIYNPLGEEVAKSTCYTDYCVATINLDRLLCHLDMHFEKLDAMQKKYGPKVKVYEPGEVALCMITSETEEFTAQDLKKEYGFITYDEYIAFATKQRFDNMKE